MIIQLSKCVDKNNKNVNAFSRLPLPETVDEIANPLEITFVSDNPNWPITSDIFAN